MTFNGTDKYLAYDVMDDASLEYQGDYDGEDVHKGNGGKDEWTTDSLQDLQLNPLKSFKTCDEDDVCTWQAHWFRNYETGDANDIQLVPGILEEYYIYGEYDCGNWSGVSDYHKIMMGHVYEEPVEEVVEVTVVDDTSELESAGAIANIAMTASAATVALFALM